MALDFPASPAVGDEYQGFKWDGNSWVPISSGGASGDFLPLTGGTLTGDLTISKPSAFPGADSLGASLILNRIDPAQGVHIIAQNAGVESWKVTLSSGEITGIPGYGDKIQFIRNSAVRVEIDAAGHMSVSGNLTVYGTFTDAALMAAMPDKSVGELLLQALDRIAALEAKI